MTTFTDKELIKEIKERIGSLDVRDNIERRAYEIALASLEAEPVAYIFKHPAGKLFWALTDESNKEQPDVIPVYADSPAPVVPDEIDVNDVPRAVTYFKKHRDCYADGWNACRAAMLQSGNFRENKNSSTNNFREIAETSTNYPVIPSEVLSAILKVAKIRADFDDFDGDRRGIGDCLDEAEQELIVTINKYASQLAAEPIAANDVREQQTAVPPVPEIQADVAQAIENLKQKLVECNRYNYCADAVKNVEDACHAAMLHGAEPASNHEELPLDYLQGQKDGLEWAAQLAEANHPQTGDWLYDDPLELAKAIRKGPDMPEFDGPTPVTLDGWISCNERMPENIPGSCKEYLVFDGLNNKVHHDYWVVPDGDSAPVASFWNHYGAHVTHWMPLPEPPKEVNRG
ncbi:TPA: DUF551 domain-containing protein [Escherichia coli]|nr:DUF551 domain-containing protein [Escherichia coli]